MDQEVRAYDGPADQAESSGQKSVVDLHNRLSGGLGWQSTLYKQCRRSREEHGAHILYRSKPLAAVVPKVTVRFLLGFAELVCHVFHML